MNKEEFIKTFEENVLYLEHNIPPDDIYAFAEQTYMAALYFLHVISHNIDIEALMKNDPIARKWISNVMLLLNARDLKEPISLDLKLDFEIQCT